MTASGHQPMAPNPRVVDDEDILLFWGCFLALITTAFGFIARMFLIGTWQTEFNLDNAQAGRLAGIGIWPFAVSIAVLSVTSGSWPRPKDADDPIKKRWGPGGDGV